MQEIERKFLVLSDAYKEESFQHQNIVQGYLSSNPARAVRVRIKGDQAFITIKGEAKSGGLSRFEWEKEIPVEEAETLLKLCEPGEIRKIRFLVKLEEHIFEIDEFFGENSGLTVAEIELKSEDETFKKPSWLGTEVTGDIRYYNSQLSKKPFTQW